MARSKQTEREKKLKDATEILRSLGFASRQCNEVAGYTLLACLDLKPGQLWGEAAAPLRGITPIIEFVATAYGVRYAPNTRETIRDEAVKYFVESGVLLRNPDDPARPTNSGKTVYQVEAHALELIRTCGTTGARFGETKGQAVLVSELRAAFEVVTNQPPVRLAEGDGGATRQRSPDQRCRVSRPSMLGRGLKSGRAVSCSRECSINLECSA